MHFCACGDICAHMHVHVLTHMDECMCESTCTQFVCKLCSCACAHLCVHQCASRHACMYVSCAGASLKDPWFGAVMFFRMRRRDRFPNRSGSRQSTATASFRSTYKEKGRACLTTHSHRDKYAGCTQASSSGKLLLAASQPSLFFINTNTKQAATSQSKINKCIVLKRLKWNRKYISWIITQRSSMIQEY